MTLPGRDGSKNEWNPPMALFHPLSLITLVDFSFNVRSFSSGLFMPVPLATLLLSVTHNNIIVNNHKINPGFHITVASICTVFICSFYDNDLVHDDILLQQCLIPE